MAVNDTRVERRRPALLHDPRSPRSLGLWFGVFGPPAAWAAQVLLGDALYEFGCAPGFTPRDVLGVPFEVVALLVTAVLAATASAAGFVAAAAWRRLGREREEAAPSWIRARAMALGGMVSSGLFTLLIAFGFLPPLILRGCVGTPGP